jgi:hypothetical protein
MKFPTFKSCALSVLALGAAAALAQDVLDTRTETQSVTIQAIEAGTTSTGLRSTVTRSAPTAFPGRTVLQETEVSVLGFQIPDFNPDDLLTHFYHVGMFSESGNGSGTVYPDDNGYAEFELSTHPGQTPWRTFLYGVDVDTGELQVFIDVDDVTVNSAVMILTNLALNSGSNAVSRSGIAGRPPFGSDRPRRRPVMPPAIGDELRVNLHGDYLTIEDLQDQIFDQTRCRVELDAGWYYLTGCD